MKKILFVALFLMLGTLAAQAQGGGGFQRRTVEERVKMIHDKMDSAFKPAADKLKEIDETFTAYYKAQDKLREEMMSGGERPDPQVMREKMQPLTDERDGKLKKILTEEQYKKWKEEIEPSMRPQRGPRQ
jgi:periplasmic protein CpxP/Spy